MKNFMSYAHIWKKVESWSRPIWVKSLKISSVSWLLPSKNFPSTFLVNSNFINSPNTIDNSLRSVKIDNLCNWKVTKDTPTNSIKEWYLLNFHSINTGNSIWEEAVAQWVETWEYKEKYWSLWNIITNYNVKACVREWKWELLIKTSITNNSITIWRNDLKVWFVWDRRIKSMQIFIWEKLIKTVNTFNKKRRWMNIPIFIPFKLLNTNNILRISLIDKEWYTYDENVDVNILDRNINQ
jgi:hypothetical protein